MAVLAATVALGGSALAQSTTTGAIQGKVSDKADGSSLAGVTVVATSPALQGSQAEISDDSGRYYLTNLPPGVYMVVFYFSNVQVQRKNVVVTLGQITRVDQPIDLGSGEVIVVTDKAPTIDTQSTNQGSNVTQEYMQNIPMPGRTFSSTLGSAAGSQGDSRGVGFSGSTSLENQYIIDGVNTTGLNSAGIGTPLINEFIEEIQVITGGYQAEFGRSTGAVVNVITKAGSNEFSGSAFATILPYQVNRTPIDSAGSAIMGTSDLDYSADFGFELGGPIVKDKVWFYVGFAPQLSQTNVNRTINRMTDCRELQPDGSLSNCDPEMYGDGQPDEDPETGFAIFEEVESTDLKTNAQAFQFVSKVNFAVAPEHQGQVSVLGTPTTGEGIFGVNGTGPATRADFTALNTDLSAKWTSKFNNNRTTLEGVIGWHRDKYDQDAIDDTLLEVPTTRVYLSDLHHFGESGGESQRVLDACRDSSNPETDDYPDITNCPVFQYWLDSPGFIINNLEDRRSGQLKVSQRVDAGGHHELKAGIDVENNLTTDVRHYSGGRFFQVIPAEGYEQTRIYRYVSLLGETGDVCGYEEDENGDPILDQPRNCDYLDTSTVRANTLNWSTFLQDSWQPQPNITINAGIRYEEQRMRYADHLRDTIDPFTDEPLGKNALVLRNMWAPRLGAIYDWTKEGRGKVYASVGRFYESIPMTLNDFSFSGDTAYGAFWQFNQCNQGNVDSPDSTGATPSPYNCPDGVSENMRPAAGEYFRGGTTLVAPGTKPQFMDEGIVGAEYEVLEDLRVGLSVTARSLGAVLEDVSIDNAETYVIGNPGVFSDEEEAKLQDEIDSLPDDSPDKERLQTRLEQFRGLRRFDEPIRDYRSVMLTASKRFSRNFFLQASYTWQQTRGNYPGLLNDDTGDALPNISTQYDLISLLPNRYGPLPQDRPHYLKLDGYYTFDLKKYGEVTTGVRFRAFSGVPLDVLGANDDYGSASRTSCRAAPSAGPSS